MSNSIQIRLSVGTKIEISENQLTDFIKAVITMRSHQKMLPQANEFEGNVRNPRVSLIKEWEAQVDQFLINFRHSAGN